MPQRPEGVGAKLEKGAETMEDDRLTAAAAGTTPVICIDIICHARKRYIWVSPQSILGPRNSRSQAF